MPITSSASGVDGLHLEEPDDEPEETGEIRFGEE